MTDRVLVVDDDTAMVRTLRDILRFRGWQCDGVHSGEEAVEAVRQGTYSTVLMDITMPGIDGVVAAGQIKQLAPDTRILLMTANGTPAALAAATREGIAQILLKPLDLNNLLTLLQ